MLKYFEFLRDNGLVPLPLFANSPISTKNTLYLSKTNVCEIQAKALNMYLEESPSIEQLWIKTLIIDDCGVKDKNFEILLDGFIK